MKVFIPREMDPAETRVSLLPAEVAKLVKLGAEIEFQARLGETLAIADEEYEKAGARTSNDRNASLAAAQLVLRMGTPTSEDIRHLGKGCIHISYLDPFNNTALIKELADQGVSGISLEMIPRTTIAQKMDV